MKYEKSQGEQDGIFTEQRTVTSVTDLSGTVHPHIMKAFDLYVQLNFAPRVKDGKTFEVYPLDIFGNLKRDEVSGKVDESAWGSAFKVGDAFHQMGIQLELDSNFAIPPGLIAAAAGKEVTVLTYIYKAKKNDEGVYKAKYAVWDRVMGPDKGKELKAEFMKQVKAGFIKNYKPNAVAEANEEKALAESVGATQPVAGEEDLPF